MEKLAFLFPGQGSQFVGMSQSLYDQFPIARQTFEEANDILGFDLAKTCFEGSLSVLAKNVNAQPAILVSSVASFRVYMQEIGIAPQFCAGHSLGEYSALTCAGAIAFADAVKIVRFRGELTDELVTGDIGAISIIDGIDRFKVEEECKKWSTKAQFVGISCYNSPVQTDISGVSDLVMRVEEALLETAGCMVTPLLASAPFHSPLMENASIRLKEELERYTYHWFKYPVISNVTATPYNEPEKIVDFMVKHIKQPVQWQETMHYLARKGVTLAIEMGPKNVLSNLVGANVDSIRPSCFAQKEDRQALYELHTRYPFLKKHFPTVITKCLAAGVATPNQNWNEEEYREGIIKPYKRIQEIQEQLENAAGSPTLEQMSESLFLLKTIFQTKKLPLEEQKEWYRQILDETGQYYTLSDVFKQLSAEEKPLSEFAV